jgi:glucan phosphoethanolaminetransferase (alkaline phosphatase superfamily)
MVNLFYFASSSFIGSNLSSFTKGVIREQSNNEISSRYSSSNYTSSEFGYIRSQNESSNHASLDSSALDAGRSMTPDNKHY